MISTLVKTYDITTMSDNRDLILFNSSEYTYESALKEAKDIIPTMGYGDDYIEPTEDHVQTVWVNDNPQFDHNPDSEYAYFYSDPSCCNAYLVIGVELIYKD